MIVPEDLRQFVGKRELRYSLKTGYRKEARAKAFLLAGKAGIIFRVLRKGGAGLSKLSDNQIQDIVKKYLEDTVKMLEERWLLEESPVYKRDDLHNYVRDLDYIKQDIIEYLGTCDYSTVEGIADDLLEKHEVFGLEKDSYSYQKLCREILKAQAKELEIEKRQMLGDYSADTDTSWNGQFPISLSGKGSSPVISEVIEKHAAEARINWTNKTEAETLASLHLFIEIVGDVPIQSISRKRIAEFKQVLMKLPPNIKKSPKYRGKSISQILKMNVPKTLSTLTVSKHLSRVGALFEYACKNGLYEGLNPATDMQPPKKRRAVERRAPFTREDLVKLFHSEEYLSDRHKQAYQFWTLIIALYTGARQNEIAQLYLSDIKQTDERVWVFDINDEKDKKLKTKSSKRIIPIHPFLLNDLNFLSYVKRLKAKGRQRLFPELKKGRDGYGRNVSYWFNKTYKQKCGIVSPDGRKRDFHSFRATFITRLAHQKADHRMRLQVEGHADTKDMTSVYADPFTAKQLLDEIISKLDYGIDLSHLKNSKYVVKASLGTDV
jgi:integrase